MSAHLKKITTRAKQIRAKNPGKKWTTCIKEASRELHKPTAARKRKKRVSGISVVAGVRHKRHKRRKVGAYKFVERNETKATPPKKTYRVSRSKKGRIVKMESLAGFERHYKNEMKGRLEIQLGELMLKRELNTKRAPHVRLTRRINEVRAKLRAYK